MSLTDIIKDLDQSVQKQYTRLGRKVSEDKLYYLTFSLGAVGVCLGFVGLNYLYSLPNLPWHLTIGMPNSVYDLRSIIVGKNKNSGDVTSIDPVEHFIESYNRKLRLPIFLTAASHLSLFGYQLLNSFFTQEPLLGDSAGALAAGLGFLGLASSMYLKDQDPKLLEKEKEEENIKSLTPVYEQQ